MNKAGSKPRTNKMPFAKPDRISVNTLLIMLMDAAAPQPGHGQNRFTGKLLIDDVATMRGARQLSEAEQGVLDELIPNSARLPPIPETSEELETYIGFFRQFKLSSHFSWLPLTFTRDQRDRMVLARLQWENEYRSKILQAIRESGLHPLGPDSSPQFTYGLGSELWLVEAEFKELEKQFGFTIEKRSAQNKYSEEEQDEIIAHATGHGYLSAKLKFGTSFNTIKRWENGRAAGAATVLGAMTSALTKRGK